MTLTDAQAWCSRQNGNLPIPESAAENDFLKRLGNTWLGFRTNDMTRVTFTNWRSGEPSGDSTEVQLIAQRQKWGYGWNGRWNDGTGTFPATCYVKETIHLPSGRQITYVRSNVSMTLTDAEAWCSRQNGNLPIPESTAENDFLRSLGNTWLGFRTNDITGVPFTNWRSGEPSGESTEVVLIADGQKWGYTWNGRWNDVTGSWPFTCYVKEGDDLTDVIIKHQWVKLMTCDGTHHALTCDVDMTVGISRTKGRSTQATREERRMASVEVAMGFEVGGDTWGGKVTGEMRAKIEAESTIGRSLTTSHSEAFTEETTRSAQFAVAQGDVVSLCQYQIRVDHLKMKLLEYRTVPGRDCNKAK